MFSEQWGHPPPSGLCVLSSGDTSHPLGSVSCPCIWLGKTQWGAESGVMEPPTCLSGCESPLSELYRTGCPLLAHSRPSLVLSTCPAFHAGLSRHHPLTVSSKFPRLSLCLHCSPSRNSFPLLPALPSVPIVQWVGEGGDITCFTIFISWEVRKRPNWAPVEHLEDGGASSLSIFLSWG